jgi:hypothetical protein
MSPSAHSTSSRSASYQGDAVADRHEDALDAVVVRDVLVEGRDPLVAGEGGERVVGEDDAVRRELREQGFVVVDVVRLPRADEDEVERPVER